MTGYADHEGASASMSEDDTAATVTEAPATDVVAGLGFTREPWTARGACRGAGADVFFTERGEATAPAKAVCATCPVIDECLDYAMRNGERYGIWGGTSERERRRMRRDRPKAEKPHGTMSRYAQGCHCDECTEANRERIRRYRTVAA